MPGHCSRPRIGQVTSSSFRTTGVTPERVTAPSYLAEALDDARQELCTLGIALGKRLEENASPEIPDELWQACQRLERAILRVRVLEDEAMRLGISHGSRR
jgi:hypothetical protein